VRGDGEVVAVESRALFVHQRELGAAYRNVLAAELDRLGFAIERGTGRGGRFFELAGVPASLREAWSSRHRQIREAIRARLERKQAEREAAASGRSPNGIGVLEAPGALSPAEERVIALESRAAKETLRTEGDLDRVWWETAREHDFDARSVERLRGILTRPADAAIDEAVATALTEFDATFAAREARATALERSSGLGLEAAYGALSRLVRRGELFALGDGRLTTRAHRARERETVELVRGLASARVGPIDPAVTRHELAALGDRLKADGGALSGEQTRAVRAGCSDRQLLVIEGQAGTGKSTVLAAVARAHQRAGRRIVVTSTGALAAERLTSDLRAVGVDARGYSTAALKAHATHGRLTLDETTTVIHDEAALASTREQYWLFSAVNERGARLIAVGDPSQSQPVGAGGLWPHIERAARQHAAQITLTDIRRSRDPDDRRDQALWRAGHHARSLAGYHRRGRLTIAQSHREAEDAALEAATADHRRGRHTLVICETSNEHLDELNARVQAIRHEHGELGPHTLALARRPYGLRAGDSLQIRSGTRHPRLGRLNNGMTGQVLDVDPEGERANIRFADGRSAHWARQHLNDADVRLGYVQHPFPAQGTTSDTTHVITGQHATRHGTYVALTRARDQTRLYSSREHLRLDAVDGVTNVVEALSSCVARDEPAVPSLGTPLTHERRIERLLQLDGLVDD
jgi:AAA domain/TrwC relaxase